MFVCLFFFSVVSQHKSFKQIMFFELMPLFDSCLSWNFDQLGSHTAEICHRVLAVVGVVSAPTLPCCSQDVSQDTTSSTKQTH